MQYGGWVLTYRSHILTPYAKCATCQNNEDECFEALHKLVWAVHRRAISRKGAGTGGDDFDAAELIRN